MAATPPNVADLIGRIRTIDRRLAELDLRIAYQSKHQSRTLKLLSGSVATLAGLLLAPPTGGLTAFIAGLGVFLFADALREDALLDNERRAVAAERDHLHRLLNEVERNLIDRGL